MNACESVMSMNFPSAVIDTPTVDWYNALPDDAPERQNKLIDEDSLAAINEKAKALSN